MVIQNRGRPVTSAPSTQASRIFRGALSVSISLILGGCLFQDDGSASDAVVADGDYVPRVAQLPAGWPAVSWPHDNPFTPAKAILGRRLFFDTILSRDRTVSCGSCHHPDQGFADPGVPRSIGVHGLRANRNSPTLTNMAFNTSFLSEGGVPTLELQAIAPLFAENEMDMTGSEIEARLAVDTLYIRLFRQAYGDVPITLAGVTKALATYQRTLVSTSSSFDRWQAGETSALSASAQRGAALFLGEKADCWHCHAPPLFTDRSFHNIGLDTVLTDLGRALVTGQKSDEGKFKTPTLRNVGVTGPYMHDGRFTTLRQIVEHYNNGGKSHPNTSPLLRPLGLTTGEIDDLVSFLESLTDSAFLRSTKP
jgi:cytochrome c peroxidase